MPNFPWSLPSSTRSTLYSAWLRLMSSGRMGLEPGRLVGGHGKGGTVGLAETEAAECLEGPPDLVHHFWSVIAGTGFAAEEFLHRRLQGFVAQGAPEFVRAGQPTPGHDVESLEDLLMEDRHSMGFLENGFEVRVRIHLRGEPKAVFQEGAHHVRFHGSRPEQGDVDNEVVELPGRQLSNQFPLTRGFDLETPKGVGAADQLIGWFVIEGDGVEVDPAVCGNVVRSAAIRTCG